jgi:AraC-like DNA-binding protein
VEDVAKRLNVPADTLRKRFVRKERMPLSRFILCEKIERIKSQLLETDEKCLTICLGVGWREDVGARIFKRIVGMTMMEYRDHHTGMDKIAGGQSRPKRSVR